MVSLLNRSLNLLSETFLNRNTKNDLTKEGEETKPTTSREAELKQVFQNGAEPTADRDEAIRVFDLLLINIKWHECRLGYTPEAFESWKKLHIIKL